MSKLVALFIGLSLSTLLHAEPATEEATTALLIATRPAEALGTTLPEAEQQIRAMLDRALKGEKNSPQLQKVRREMASKMSQVLFEEFSFDAIRRVIAPAYQENFSLEEMQQITAFFSSPAGRQANEAFKQFTTGRGKLNDQQLQQGLSALTQFSDTPAGKVFINKIETIERQNKVLLEARTFQITEKLDAIGRQVWNDAGGNATRSK